jgi:hypothetical protein
MARLREEAESPFRPLRFFVYGSTAASGAIGALISLTGALAAASGAYDVLRVLLRFKTKQNISVLGTDCNTPILS